MILSQAFKHIFTSPSSVDKEPKATRSGNARLHGMTKVSPASIAYVTTQVCGLSFMLFHVTNLCYAGPICSELISCLFPK